MREAIIEHSGHRHRRRAAPSTTFAAHQGRRLDHKVPIAPTWATGRRALQREGGAQSHPADLHHRVPAGDCPVRQEDARTTRASWSASRASSPAWRRATRSASSTTRRPARAIPEQVGGRGRRRRDPSSTRTSSPRWCTACRRPAAWAWASTGWPCCSPARSHPRGHPLPAASRLAAEGYRAILLSDGKIAR